MKKKFAIILALFLIAVVCSAGCIDPQDPVEPVVPVDPIDPITPVDPVVPIDPEVPVEEYSVLFMLNYDDAGAYVTETVKAGEIVSKPSNPTRNGHTFKGWFTAVEGGAEYDFTQAVNADVTLYAQWSKKSSGSSGGHSHSYSWNVVKAANCTVDGQGQYVCSCGQVKATEAIPATGHLETEEVINEETHTTEVKCKACGIVLVTIPESNVLEIKTVEELKAFAETVNAGTDYAGKTVTLVYDLDLKNEPWSPIGTPENVFAGTFNGNGKTILNLKVTGTENVGFFGVLYGTVQNLKIDGAAITGNHYLGAVVGYVKSGTVSDCTVTDAVITATPNKVSDAYDNGDKVGGIVGYGYNGDDGSFTVSDCTVTDSTLTAFRDVGGIVGAANGDDVSGNNVERVSIVVDKATNAYDNDGINGAAVLGRNLGGVLGSQTSIGSWSVTIIEDGKLQKVTTFDGTSEDTYYAINHITDLQAFRDYVNAGTSYSGETIKLMADIDLGNEPWTPIGTPENVFAGTFNGNGKTILNLKVTGTENVGFFGVLYGTVQNLKIDGAAITGNHYLGAVVGYVKSGTVSDCTVTDAVITATPNKVSDAYDNGDKVGGIVGYGYNGDDGSFTVSDCTVTDSTLTAFRDVGGIVGAANGDDVSGNNVERVSIVVDKATNAYDNDAVNGNPILGRNLDSSSLITQTVTDCTVSVIAVEQESIVAAAAAGSDIALANDIAISEKLIMNGGSIDGNGKAMDVSGITPTYDCAIWTNGGTVKNLKIVGSNDDKYGDMRAIGSGSSGSLILSEDLLIENVYINNVLYAINGGGLSTVKVVVKDSEIYGWCSYSGISSFEFKNCTLGKGKSYAGYIPVYGNTAFEDCKFEDFYMCGRDNSNVGHTITFTNCMYGSEKVTAANFASLFEDDDDEEDFGKLKNYLITIDGVAVTWS